MPLVDELVSLVTRLGTEFKSVRSTVGDLASLSTTAKSSLVAAINEVAAGASGGGPVDADSITDATAVGKALIRAASALAARTAIGAGTSNLELGTTGTTAKAGDYQPAAANISDSSATGRALLTAATAAAARGTLSVYSTTEADAAAAAAVAAAIDAAPESLNTLNELAAALGDDPNFAGTTAAALGNRVRTDTNAQGLDGTQKANARTNIDVYSKAEIGDPETDLVAAFEAALV